MNDEIPSGSNFWDNGLFNKMMDEQLKSTKTEPTWMTWHEHCKKVYAEWGRYNDHGSGRMFFVNLINTVCKKIRERGLYVRVEHNDNKAIFVVSYDTPNAKEQRFCIENKDHRHFRWSRVVSDWRDL